MNLIGGVIGQHVSHNRIEGNLAASEDRLRAVVDNTSDMILLTSPTGVVTFASQAVTRILGYTPAEFVAKSGYDYIHPDDIARSQQVHAQLLQTAQMQEANIRLRRTDGSYAMLQMRLRSVHGPDGGVREIVVAARHIQDPADPHASA
jgi:PAS domain S-box-containing protein